MIDELEIARTFLSRTISFLAVEETAPGGDDWLLAIAPEADAAYPTLEQALQDAGFGSFGPY